MFLLHNNMLRVSKKAREACCMRFVYSVGMGGGRGVRADYQLLKRLRLLESFFKYHLGFCFLFQLLSHLDLQNGLANVLVIGSD